MIRESIKQVIDLLAITLKAGFLAEMKAFREVTAGITDKTQRKEVRKYWDAKIKGSSFSKFNSLDKMFTLLNIDLEEVISTAKHSLDFSGIYNGFYGPVFKPVLNSCHGVLTLDALSFLLDEFTLYCEDRIFYGERLKAKQEAENEKNFDKIAEEKTQETAEEEKVQVPPSLDSLSQQELLMIAVNCYKLLDNHHKSILRDWQDKVDNVNYQTLQKTGTEN